MKAEASIPVDMFNPSQVFACLGFLEAADMLIGDAEGWFDWRDESNVKFRLQTGGDINPVEAVLEFLVDAEIKAVAPENWRSKKKPKNGKEKEKLEEELSQQIQSAKFPSVLPDTSAAMPIQITHGNRHIALTHWADGSDRNNFKLYAGNRSALTILTEMVKGKYKKPRKGQNIGDPERRGIIQLWEEDREKLIKIPFDILTAMGGSFNFDARGAWTALDAGYSPNTQKHGVEASPVVEVMAAWGLENARPDEFETRKVRYSTWGTKLPAVLARVAFIHGIALKPSRQFQFDLDLSGKNKIVTFAEEVIINEKDF